MRIIRLQNDDENSLKAFSLLYKEDEVIGYINGKMYISQYGHIDITISNIVKVTDEVIIDLSNKAIELQNRYGVIYTTQDFIEKEYEKLTFEKNVGSFIINCLKENSSNDVNSKIIKDNKTVNLFFDVKSRILDTVEEKQNKNKYLLYKFNPFLIDDEDDIEMISEQLKPEIVLNYKNLLLMRENLK